MIKLDLLCMLYFHIYEHKFVPRWLAQKKCTNVQVRCNPEYSATITKIEPQSHLAPINLLFLFVVYIYITIVRSNQAISIIKILR